MQPLYNPYEEVVKLPQTTFVRGAKALKAPAPADIKTRVNANLETMKGLSWADKHKKGAGLKDDDSKTRQIISKKKAAKTLIKLDD